MKICFTAIGIGVFLVCMSCQSGVNKVVKVEKFSKKKPYAVKICRERSYFQADKIKERISEMGIQPYIVQFSDTLNKTGEWFQVMCGAIENKDSAMRLKSYLSKTFSFNQAEVVGFDQFPDARTDVDENEIDEVKRIDCEKPDLPPQILTLVRLFPENNALFVNNLSVVNSPDDPKSKTGYRIIYKLKLDLPRGISRKKLLEKTNCFAEVVYRDNLYGDKIIVNIGSLRKIEENDSDSAQTDKKDIAATYADLILNTGEYPTEEKSAIIVRASSLLKGYKVTISLWNKQVRTYFVLVDEVRQHLILSQSSDKTEQDLVKILQGIGKGDGLFNYGEFHNTFSTLPSTMPENENFIAFSLSRLDENYAKNKSYSKWAKKMVGHWQASGYFRNNKKGSWSYSLFDLLTQKEQNYIYKTLYWNDQSKNKVTINILGTEGIHVTSKKFNWKKFKNTYTTREINFGIGRYVCAIDNSEKSWLSKQDLIDRAEILQLATNQKKNPI